MAVPSQEATVKHLVAVYSFQKYTDIKTLFEATYGANSLAGLCFTPVRTGEAATAGNYQNAVKATFVRWVPPATASDVSQISFVSDDNAGSISPTEEPDPELLEKFKADMIEVDNLSGWDLFRHYHDVSEVEYAFIDKSTFEYLASANTFYPGGTPIGFVAGFPSRGLLLSRAFVTLQGGSAGNSYKKFRAMRMAPYPEPQLSTSPTRPSIAYHLGPICPPYWDNTGDDEIGAAGGGSTGGSEAVAPPVTERSAVPEIKAQTGGDPIKGSKDCNCVVNKINMATLHHELIKAGIISETPPPPYRFRLWPWILLLLLAVLLMVFGGVKAVQSISKKGDVEQKMIK